MEDVISVVVKEPGHSACRARIGSSLQAMQDIVGGYIEVVPAEVIAGGNTLPADQLLLVCNEEGKYEHLAPNFPIRNGRDYIFGIAFFCKGEGDEMIGLSESEADMVIKLFEGKG